MRGEGKESPQERGVSLLWVCRQRKDAIVRVCHRGRCRHGLKEGRRKVLELEDKNFIKNIIIFLLNNKKSMIHIRRCRIQVSYMDISIGVTTPLSLYITQNKYGIYYFHFPLLLRHSYQTTHISQYPFNFVLALLPSLLIFCATKQMLSDRI